MRANTVKGPAPERVSASLLALRLGQWRGRRDRSGNGEVNNGIDAWQMQPQQQQQWPVRSTMWEVWSDRRARSGWAERGEAAWLVAVLFRWIVGIMPTAGSFCGGELNSPTGI